jgi:hypothetical protein
MRGIKRTINTSITPNLIYEFDKDGNVVIDTSEGPRKGKKKLIETSQYINDTWKRKHGVSLDDEMVFQPREKGKIYIFDAYKRDAGLKSVSYSAFGADFYHLDNSLCYGNDLEYVMFEIAEHGTLLLIDKDAAEAVHLIKEDGTQSQYNVAELGLMVPVAKDGSNIDECLTMMDNLMNDKELYDELRENAYQMLKAHCDPKGIAERFVSAITE